MSDSELKNTQQQPSPGLLVVLYELDLTALGGLIYRFTSSASETTAPVFDGQTYVPINADATGFGSDSDGSLPTPTLRISNVEFTYQALLYGFNDLIGAKFTRIRTFRQFLDDGTDPDPDARFPDDIYIVSRKVRQNKILLEFELKSVLDQEDKFLPGRQILKTSCSHTYRVWNGSAFDYSNATCPYVDAVYFNRNGLPEVLPENDRCGKRLSSCKLRFTVLPFAGFPGVAKISA